MMLATTAARQQHCNAARVQMPAGPSAPPSPQSSFQLLATSLRRGGGLVLVARGSKQDRRRGEEACRVPGKVPPRRPAVSWRGEEGRRVGRRVVRKGGAHQYLTVPSTPQPMILMACPPSSGPVVC